MYRKTLKLNKYLQLDLYIYLEPPSEPREPGIVDFDNKSVTLRWNKPVDDGGRPITHFVIQKKDQFGGRSLIIISYRDRI